MKNLLTLAVISAAALTADAADLSVYSDGVLNPNLSVYGWWNYAFAFDTANPDGTGNVFSFKAADGGTDASMGIMTQNSAIPAGILHNATLEFDWYATGTGTYTIRLTASEEENYTFTVDADNAGTWQHTALKVADIYPTVSAEWNEYVNKGEGYIFSVIMSNGTPESAIYFSNVVYTDIDETWKAPEQVTYPAPTTVPVPTQNVADVVSIFGSHYPAATTFGIGGWGQSTQVETIEIEGNLVEHLTNFNYLGWEFAEHVNVEGYTYMHVDMYTPDGKTFGFTPISPGQEAPFIATDIKQGEWNSYDVPLTHWSNVNFADLFQIKFDQGDRQELYIANVYFWKDENGSQTPEPPCGDGATYAGKIENTYEQTLEDVSKEYPYILNYAITYNEDGTLTVKADFDWSNGEPVGMVAGSVFVNNVINDFIDASNRVVTTTDTYTAGQVIPVNFYIPVANGVVSCPIDYVVGSSATTAVEEIAVDNAPVEYYNLRGQRVTNPENGIFIRRQGNRTVKVIL